MEIIRHKINGTEIAEITSDHILIQTAGDGLDVMGNVYYQGFDRMILHSKNLSPAFFDLKNKMAGEILQKFSNYRMRLVILGDFSEISSQSLKDFIYESNKGRQVNFINTLQTALKLLSS